MFGYRSRFVQAVLVFAILLPVFSCVSIQGSGDAIAVGKGQVWILGAGDKPGQLSRMPVLAPSRLVPINGPKGGDEIVSFADDRLWLAIANDRKLLQLDGATGAIVKTLDVPILVAQLVADDGHLFIGGENVVLKLDSDGKWNEVCRVSTFLGYFAVRANTVAITSSDGATVTVCSNNEPPRSSEKLDSRLGPVALDGAGRLWIVALQSSVDERGRVLEIDTRGFHVVREVAVGKNPVAVHGSGSDIYVVNNVSGDVTVVRTETGRIDTRNVPGYPFAIATGPAGTWVTSSDGATRVS